MKISRYAARTAAALLFGGLTACGGGGGGGGGGGVSGGSLQYSGSSSAATITTSNASTLAANAIGGDAVASSTSSLSGSGRAQPDIGRRAARPVFAALARRDGNARFASVPIDQTDPCPEGGTVRIFGEVIPTGAGQVTVVYTNCAAGGDAISGQATMRIDLFSSGIPINYTLSFERLAIRGVTNADISGSVHVVTDVPTNTETVTENSVSLYVGSGRMTKSENLVLVDVYDNVFEPTNFTETLSGRIFDSLHGYVDLATLSPLLFSPATQAFPSGGLLQLTGAQNRRILVTLLSSDMLRLGLDLNADGVFETVAMLTRAQLTGPVGADLADSDGDGLHNGWESAFGATDPVADADADGFSNLSEYHGGGNPDDGSAIPKLATSVFPLASNVAVADSGWMAPGKIASDGKGFLVVTCRASGSPPALVVGINYGLLISDMGQVLNNFPISTYFCAGSAVAFDGTNYLVVLPRDGALRGFFVSRTGAVLTSGDGFLIAANALGSANIHPAVAFDGANYLVVWTSSIFANTTIRAARVSPAGTLLGEFAITTGPNGFDSEPVVAFGGGVYLVAWTNGPEGSENVFGARVSPAGVVLDASPVAIATAANRQRVAGVASDGTNFLVVWNHASPSSTVPPPDGRIFARRVAPDMTVLDGAAGSDGIAISTGLFVNHSASVTFTGSNFLVTWAVSTLPSFPPVGIYAARVSKSGNRLDGPAADLGVPVSGPPGVSSQYVLPVAGSNGKSALIAWVDIYGKADGKDVLAALIYGP